MRILSSGEKPPRNIREDDVGCNLRSFQGQGPESIADKGVSRQRPIIEN